MNWKTRNMISIVGQLLPLKCLMAGKKHPPFLPFYHLVTDRQHEFINSYHVRDTATFELELEYLLKHFNPVSIDELLRSPKKNSMHLSFDDGLKECFTVIAPILKRKGIPATFFVSSGFVDNNNLFHRFKRSILETKGVLQPGGKKYFIHEVGDLNRLAENAGIDFSTYQPYMTVAEIQALHNDGFTIGAHSIDHPEMWLLGRDEQYLQVAESMKWVSDHFNPTSKVFSFPFTDDGISMELFKRLHQNKIVDATFGTAGLKHDCVKNHFQRVPIERVEDWSIKRSVHYEYFYYFVRSLFNENCVKH
jgi:peptidoglycan/xylan/chitin deacetylase (PgdA/CDA1 family)